jgi:ribosome assembly protein RRB1
MPPKRKDLATAAAQGLDEGDENAEALIFEDPFGDEFEEEEFDDNGEDYDDEDVADGEDMVSSSGNTGLELEDENAPKQVWRPGIDQLEEGETLEYDPEAYVMYHALRTEWPCLTFDVLKDNFGDARQRVSVFVSYKSLHL